MDVTAHPAPRPGLVVRAVRFLDALAERRIPALLSYGVAVVSVVFGAALVFIPDPAWMDAEYGAAFVLARPGGWGLAFMVLGAALAASYALDPRSSRIVALLVTLLYTVLSANAAFAPASGGRPDVSLFTAFIAWVAALVVLTAGTGPRSTT